MILTVESDVEALALVLLLKTDTPSWEIIDRFLADRYPGLRFSDGDRARLSIQTLAKLAALQTQFNLTDDHLAVVLDLLRG